jgi:phage pi2 protein 07
MALPKLNTPTYELELPSTGEKIKYRPFLVKEQKILMMAQEGKDEQELNLAMTGLVSDCTFGTVDATNSPMFDVEYIFLRVRGKSVGEKVTLSLICPDDGKTEVPYELNLEEVGVTMTDNHSNIVKVNDEVTIHFRYPYMKDMLGIPADINETEKSFHILNGCIDSIHYGDDAYNRVDLSEKDISDFIDQLTTEQFEKVMVFFNTMPKVRHTVTFVNPKTSAINEVVLEGLESFLE